MRARMKERRERHKRELRESILEAATEIFERQGYEGFSLRQVAETVGYSATTIYLYFRDRDDLLLAVCKQGIDGITQQMTEAFNSTSDPLERLRALSRAYCHAGLVYPLYYRVLFVGNSSFTELLAAELSRAEEAGEPTVRSLHYQAVERAMQAGLLRPGDPRQVANLIWAGQHGLLDLHLSMAGRVPGWQREAFDALLEEWLKAIVRGLQP